MQVKECQGKSLSAHGLGEKEVCFHFFLLKVRIDIFLRGQTQTLDGFVVAIKKPPPPVQKLE